jgi:hypothetical protein
MSEMKTLGREEDIEESRKAAEDAPSFFVKIPDVKTPWILLDLAYSDSFVHWVDIGGRSQRVVCGGGVDGKGFDTDNCPLCALTLEMYQEAKELREGGEEAKADRIKNSANRLHGKFEAQFLAVRGQRIVVKTTKGKRYEADFDLDSEDEDSTVEVGVLSLTENMYKGLTGLIKGEGTEFVKSGTDLGNRILWTVKEHKRKQRKFKEVSWNADRKECEIPDVEIPEEIDIETAFDIDMDEIDRVYSLLTGEASEEVGEDEEVDMEEDSEEEPDDSDLDEDEEDEEDEEILDDVEEDEEVEDDFEDDLPYEEEEEEEPEPKKTRTTSRTRSKAKKAAPKTTRSKSKAKPSTSSRARSKSAREAGTTARSARKSGASKSRSKSGSSTKRTTTPKKKTSGKARI